MKTHTTEIANKWTPKVKDGPGNRFYSYQQEKSKVKGVQIQEKQLYFLLPVSYYYHPHPPTEMEPQEFHHVSQ